MNPSTGVVAGGRPQGTIETEMNRLEAKFRQGEHPEAWYLVSTQVEKANTVIGVKAGRSRNPGYISQKTSKLDRLMFN